jgi:hypothetical protein
VTIANGVGMETTIKAAAADKKQASSYNNNKKMHGFIILFSS